MNQNIWGPSMWFSLHTITFSYPIKPTELEKANYKIFFENFKNVIPCSVCKKNYIRHLKEHPIDNYLSTRKKIVYWLIDLHNMVNVETGKKIIDYDIVIKKYEKIYKKKIIIDDDNSETNNNSNNIDSCNNSNKIDSCNNSKVINNINKKYILNMDDNKVLLLFIIFIVLLLINIFYNKK
jgi:hypothetical protein